MIEPISEGGYYLAKKGLTSESYASTLKFAIKLILPAVLDYKLGYKGTLFLGPLVGSLFQGISSRVTKLFFEEKSTWSFQHPQTKKFIENSISELSYYLGVRSSLSIYSYYNSYSSQHSDNQYKQHSENTKNSKESFHKNHEKSFEEKTSSQQSDKCGNMFPVKLSKQEIFELQSRACTTSNCKETAKKALGLNAKKIYNQSEIKNASRCRLLTFHPDKCTYSKEVCAEQITLINNARMILQ